MGALYARVLIDSAAAPEEHARIRKILGDSTDVELLATVGTFLSRISGSATGAARVVRELGESYRNRAAILEPQSVTQRVVQRDLVQELNWDQDMQTRLVGRAPRGAVAVGSTAGRDEFLKTLTDIERLAVLPRFAEQTYAEGVAATSHPKESPTAIWERAAGYAHDALSLADRLAETPLHQPVRYQAHLVLSVVELRAGRREESVTHLLEAARLAPSDRLALTTSMVEERLVAYLLEYGERSSIVEFLERTAVLKPAERDERLASIEALKQNRMPAPYQRILTLDGHRAQAQGQVEYRQHGKQSFLARACGLAPMELHAPRPPLLGHPNAPQVADQRSQPHARSHLLGVLCLAFLTLTVSGEARAQRELHWSRLDVVAHLDADGTLEVTETQTIVFTGDWNGGERRFIVHPRQRFDFVGISHITADGGQGTYGKTAASTMWMTYAWTDATTLRWRSRKPSDPAVRELSLARPDSAIACPAS